MEQVSTVEKLIQQDVDDTRRQLRSQNRVTYVEDDDTVTRSSSVDTATEELDHTDPRTRVQRSQSVGSFGIIWSHDDSTDHMIQNARLFLQQPLQLSREENGWEKIVNFNNTRETVYQDHHQQQLRGLHFFTACALLVSKCENVTDDTGFGTTPTVEGNEEIAREWLGRLYQSGVKRLGNGCVFEQIKFSNAARKGLAGAGARPPDPSHVATFFSQLFNASADKHDRRRPQLTRTTTLVSDTTSNTMIPPPHAPVPQEILDNITSQAKALAPAGMDLRILENAVKTIASKKGATFRDKQLGGLKALSNGMRSKETERERYQEIDWSTAMSSKQATSAAISMSVDALESARITKSNAGVLNLGHENVKKCILAVITRRFTSSDFQLHLLIPRTIGAPDTKDMKAALGEAQNNLRVGTMAHVSSEVDDRKYYMYLRLAIEAMIVIASPTLDFGLTAALRFYAENTPIFEVSGTPLCMVTRALCKTLTSAMRQRDQDLIMTTDDTELLLCYKETLEVNRIKQKLLGWSRDDQEDEFIRFKRCMDTYQSPSSTKPTDTGKRRETPNARQPRYEKTEAKSENKMVALLHTSTVPTWTEKFGTKMVNGSKVKLCWFHCNRKQGCAKEATCPNDHTHYPDKYRGKKFAELSEALRNDIARICKP